MSLFSFRVHCITIEKEAFRDDTNLTTVVFPNMQKEGNSDATIGLNAFYNCNLSAVNLQNWHNLTLIDKHSFYKNVNLGEVHICTHTKLIKGGGQGNGAFDDCEKITLVQIHCCNGTHVDDCVCERDAFDQKVTYGDTDISQIESAAKLQYCEESGVSGAAVSGHTDTNVFKDEGYTYASPFDFFVGDWKGDLLITQANLNEQWRNNALNGWQQFLNGGDPIFIDDGKFIRTYSRADNEGATVLPAGITAYRAVGYKSGAASASDPSVGGYIELVALKHTFTEGNASVSKSYVPLNTGVVLISTAASVDALLYLTEYNGSEVLTPYPNTEAYDADMNERNFMFPSKGSNLKVYPSTPWPYVDGASVTHRNFGLYKVGEDTYKWYRFLPSQADNTDYDLRDHYAYAHLPAKLFTNPNEKGDSPNLDQANAIIQEDQGNGSNIAVGFVIIDELTGVKTIKNIDSSEGDFWYTIQGVKVEHPTKGVYIHNNRKVVIK